MRRLVSCRDQGWAAAVHRVALGLRLLALPRQVRPGAPRSRLPVRRKLAWCCLHPQMARRRDRQYRHLGQSHHGSFSRLFLSCCCFLLYCSTVEASPGSNSLLSMSILSMPCHRRSREVAQECPRNKVRRESNDTTARFPLHMYIYMRKVVPRPCLVSSIVCRHSQITLRAVETPAPAAAC